MSSPWLQARHSGFAPLRDASSFDVAVIGGGIAGMTTALLLKRSGATVAVLEADQVASGATGNNTAKATALQSTMYSTIRRHRGVEAAQVYAAASTAAVEEIAELSAGSEIHRRPAYTFAVDEAGARAVEQEIDAAREAGLPVDSDDLSELPFPVTAAEVEQNWIIPLMIGQAVQTENVDTAVDWATQKIEAIYAKYK